MASIFSSSASGTEEGMDVIPLFIGIGVVLFLLFIAFIVWTIIKSIWKKNLFKIHKKNFLQKMHSMDCFSIDGVEAGRLHNLALRCWETGLAIDEHTGRINNVNLVSDIIYKMTLALNMEKLDQALYFCAAMIYDIGFLDVPGYIFMTEILTQEERNLVKTHVMRFQDRLAFIPEKWQFFFMQAAICHHENVDGSGYPDGHKEKEIPLIARMLRIVESYVSLTTARAYHRAKTSPAALDELKDSPSYDKELVAVLEKVLAGRK
ncbi:HD domain-containing phosphohydrolase [Treponema sp.]|uniref:HD-GYP domain-containing protein n=1 Tax=Treponema sp. TaxID=166 RepID=UPI0025FA9069|nr:HD domain-containing phosphohydrolase [Treponema sp.]